MLVFLHDHSRRHATVRHARNAHFNLAQFTASERRRGDTASVAKTQTYLLQALLPDRPAGHRHDRLAHISSIHLEYCAEGPLQHATVPCMLVLYPEPALELPTQARLTRALASPVLAPPLADGRALPIASRAPFSTLPPAPLLCRIRNASPAHAHSRKRPPRLEVGQVRLDIVVLQAATFTYPAKLRVPRLVWHHHQARRMHGQRHSRGQWRLCGNLVA